VIKRLVFAATLVAASAAPAFATDATLDPPHTQAQFTVTHLALSKVHGQLPLISGTVTFNDAGLPTASAASFDMKGVDTHDENRDKSLRSDYFETDKFPTMTFTEKGVTGTPSAFKMTGDLTLHGVTKPVVLTGTVDGTATMRGKKHVAYTAHTVIDRRDFGIVFAKMLDNALFAGNEVTIDIEADATEK
jgi:polyisoprenoid-binding protein YceI